MSFSCLGVPFALREGQPRGLRPMNIGKDIIRKVSFDSKETEQSSQKVMYEEYRRK
jgi:hypothetical protein